MLKFNHFKTLLKELKLFDDYMPTLLSSGFDEWESLVELNEEILNEIGSFSIIYIFFFLIKLSSQGINHPIIIKEIMGCLQSAKSYDIHLHGNQEKKVFFF